MTITTTTLSKAAGAAAVVSGLIFIGVQVNHPHMDAVSVTTTEVVVRNSLKVLMAVLALVGITGMYLRQVKQTGVLGLIGFLLLNAGYLVIMSTSFVAAYVLPSIAGTDPSYVDDVLAAYDLHASSFVTKPTAFEEYVEAVGAFRDFWLRVARVPAQAA